MTQQWQRWKGIMKCYPFEEKRLTKWEPPYLVQPKYDGFRCRAIPTESGYILLSSEENITFSVPHINEELNRLHLIDEFDGELYCHGLDFNAISSIVSRTVNLHSDYKSIQFHVFDVINDQPQVKRLTYINQLKGMSSSIIVAPVYPCYNLEDVLSAYDTIVNNGYEGIIVRHLMAPYERKRSIWTMKFKPKQQDDYQIISFQEMIDKDGNFKDTLGALTCISDGHVDIKSNSSIIINYKTSMALIDGVIYSVFSVGTGFSDERRKQLWEGRDLLVGQDVQVKYQHITSGNKVPRFPVFVEIKVNL